MSVLRVIYARGNASINGGVLVDDIDALTATPLLVGKSVATKVEIGDVGVITEIQGPLNALGDVTMNSNKITGLGAPTLDNDASTKKYVDDNVVAGGVTSVNTRTGAVVLTNVDVGMSGILTSSDTAAIDKPLISINNSRSMTSAVCTFNGAIDTGVDPVMTIRQSEGVDNGLPGSIRGDSLIHGTTGGRLLLGVADGTAANITMTTTNTIIKNPLNVSVYGENNLTHYNKQETIVLTGAYNVGETVDTSKAYRVDMLFVTGGYATNLTFYRSDEAPPHRYHWYYQAESTLPSGTNPTTTTNGVRFLFRMHATAGKLWAVFFDRTTGTALVTNATSGSVPVTLYLTTRNVV